MDREIEHGVVEEALLEHAPPPGAPLTPHLMTNRPFLWLVVSMGVANLGFWAYFGAVWADAAYRFHANPAQMSILLASFSVPFVLLVPVQGVMVDRWSPKWLAIVGIVVTLAAVVPAWAASSIRFLYLSSLLVGAGIGTIAPARSALTGLLVKQSQLVQANGMTSAAIQSALIVGPLTGGFVLRTYGTGALYPGVIAVVATALVPALLVPDRRQTGRRPALSLADLGVGIRTSWRIPDLRLLLYLSAVAWTVVNVYWVLQPLFIRHGLHAPSDAVQFLWSAQGVGALGGSVLLYRLKDGAGRELGLTGAGLALTGLGIVALVGLGNYAAAFGASALYGLGFSMYFSSALALIQRLAGEEQRGRVTSVFAVLQEGTAILAAIVIVSLGSLVSVRPTLVGSGLVLALAAGLGLRALAGMGGRREPALPG